MEVSPFDPDAELVDVAHCATLAVARECALVLAAKGMVYSIVRNGDEWLLCVEPHRKPEASSELRAYFFAEAPQDVPSPNPEPVLERVRFWSLSVAAWGMLMLSVLQAERSPDWEGRGILASNAVISGGEWWRVVTALTLHGDVPHVLANLASGLLFAGLLIPRFGQGVTWLFVLLSGALGNLCNALLYMHEVHRSLGASTAVFGALGLLSGDALTAALLHSTGYSWWRWVLPLGAGLALLAYLGTGGQEVRHVDVLAHFWGFLMGLPLGVLGGFWRPRERVGRFGQTLCGCLAIGVIVGAWWLASALRTFG